MEDIINEELNEELEEIEDTNFVDDSESEEEDINFDYDDDGNIVIPSDVEETTENAAPASEDANTSEDNAIEPDVAPEADNSTSSTDAKDVRIAELLRNLEERDLQIKETLRSLGADENGGVAELERLAAEASDMSIEEYRRQKAERLQREEAMRVVQQQRFEEKKRADLAAVHLAYPETKEYKSVYEFPNFKKFSKYRDLGLPPAEAYIAANYAGVISNVAVAAQQRTRNLNSTKRHLQSNVPVASKDNSIKITPAEMAGYRDLFPHLSDRQIVALHKQTMKK